MMKTIKVLFNAPVQLFQVLWAYTPRRVFIAGYKPSSEVSRDVQTIARNNARHLRYYLTKVNR